MTRRISLGVREIAVRDAGNPRASGPAVLLLHGGGFDLRSWERVADALARQRRVVCLDLPGHGGSTGPACHSAADAVEVVEGVRAQLGLEALVLIGHSMGGAVAQAYARSHPGRVAALGLVSTAPHFGLDEAVVESWRAEGLSYSRERLDALVSPGASEALRQRVLELRGGMTLAAVHGDLDLCLGWDGREHCDAFDVPVLVMTAPHDIPVIREVAAGWAASLPRAELCEIPGAGHMMMVEQPERTADALSDWVQRATSRSASQRRVS